jgi:hypothetical protein
MNAKGERLRDPRVLPIVVAIGLIASLIVPTSVSIAAFPGFGG